MSALVIGAGLLYMVLARSHVNGDARTVTPFPVRPLPQPNFTTSLLWKE